MAEIEIWRGGVATWECDSMGHLNVGFYVAKCMEALAGLAGELGMPRVFAASAEATVIVREQHIRFLREARPGAPLSITGGVIGMGEADARLLFLMRHQDGELAASFQTVVAHATAGEGRAFPWPDRIRTRAEALKRFTLWPAYASFREKDLGTIEPGKIADFTGFTGDIMTIPG